MCACVGVCRHVAVHVCERVCVCVCIGVRNCVCTSVAVFTCACACVCRCMPVSVSPCAGTCLSACPHVQACAAALRRGCWPRTPHPQAIALPGVRTRSEDVARACHGAAPARQVPSNHTSQRGATNTCTTLVSTRTPGGLRRRAQPDACAWAGLGGLGNGKPPGSCGGRLARFRAMYFHEK